jgi:hypothetical protein
VWVCEREKESWDSLKKSPENQEREGERYGIDCEDSGQGENSVSLCVRERGKRKYGQEED